jgi:hypothetical protein
LAASFPLIDRHFSGIFRAKGVLMQELPYDASETIRDRTTAPQPLGRAARRIGESTLDAFLEQPAVAIREETNTTDVRQVLASRWRRSSCFPRGPRRRDPAEQYATFGSCMLPALQHWPWTMQKRPVPQPPQGLLALSCPAPLPSVTASGRSDV